MDEGNSGGFAWGLVSALLPMLGWVLYFSYKNTRPALAASVARGAKVGVGLYILGAVVAGVILIDELTSTPNIQYTTTSGDAPESGDRNYYVDGHVSESEIDVYVPESEMIYDPPFTSDETLESELETESPDDDVDSEASSSTESYTESSNSDNSANTITGQGTASQIVLRATSGGKATISFTLGSTKIKEEFTGSYEKVLTAAEVADVNNQNYLETLITFEGDAESVTCSIEVDGVAFSNTGYPDLSHKFTICQVLPVS